jgi:16S rRNA (guanine1516-N2)-methyltransferase
MRKNSTSFTSARPLIVDFIGGSLNHRLNFGGGIKQNLAKAVGIKSGIRPDIIDATAGLGRDSFILASMGSHITLIERSQIMHDLLADGMSKASREGGKLSEVIARMTLIHGDAIEILPQTSTDVIYIDPMHPPRQKSALVKTEMRQIRAIVGEDLDQPELIKTALGANCRRVALKWPAKSPLPDGLPECSHQLVGKSVRFDIFMNANLDET